MLYNTNRCFKNRIWSGASDVFLSNELLLQSYKEAVVLKLDADFVELLLDEICRRGISL